MSSYPTPYQPGPEPGEHQGPHQGLHQGLHPSRQSTHQPVQRPGPDSGPGRPPGRERNTAGRAALVLGLILMALSLSQQFVVYFLPFVAAGDWAAYQTHIIFNVIASIVLGLLALATVIVAIVGLTGPPRPRAAAGVGLGIGGSILLSIVASAGFAAASGAWFG